MVMREYQQSQNARKFAQEWSGIDYKEKGNTSKFWIELLEQVFGVNNGAKAIEPEMSVPTMDNTTDYIDVYIKDTRVIIEQKAPNKDLSQKEPRPSFKQYNGYVTPFEQARTYSKCLPLPMEARWIITCNFHEFWIYDMATSGTHPKPTIIKLKDLWKYYYQLDFLIDPTKQNVKKETKVSVKACTLITDIYHQLLSQYSNPNDPAVLNNINLICVRLVFCLYADDSGLFNKHGMFRDYMSKVPPELWRLVLSQLFNVLNQPEDKRSNQNNSTLAQFPYVNGGMFAGHTDVNSMPRFTKKTCDLILDAGNNFDWSLISPTVFGALFESTLSAKQRHDYGMHYTSIPNIHKVIDPLFLNHYRHRLNVIKTKYKSHKTIAKHAKQFQDDLASLTFFDPACGSGNFLTETFLCLRRLENEAIKLRIGKNGQIQEQLGVGKSLIEVSIHQFYGIEINDFAVSVAKTAMWIAESQMVQETQNIISREIEFLPLKSNPNIIQADALTYNWDDLIKPSDLNYIISNPPFVGNSPENSRNKIQKKEMQKIMTGFNGVGQLDYVTCWYKKALDMMQENKKINTTLVSTNSITQGVQVANLWNPLLKAGLHINYAYRSFKWVNTAKHGASVYCVVINISFKNSKHKILYDEHGVPHLVNNISPYLYDLPDILVSRRRTPITKVPEMSWGSKATDHTHLSKWTPEDRDKVVSKYPQTKGLFKEIMGAREFLHHGKRYCLWLKNADPSLWIHVPDIVKAVKAVKEYRLNSKKTATQRAADTPSLFQEDRQPNHNYIIVPMHSSSKRTYIPMGYESKDIIAPASCLFVPTSSLYIFGIMSSTVHVTWAKLVSGRLKNDFRYSSKITYNNFPWIEPNNTQKNKIIKTAKGILKARKLYPKTDLADLYNPLSMPQKLLKAHQQNDKEVLKLYHLPANASSLTILNQLLVMYQKMSK